MNVGSTFILISFVVKRNWTIASIAFYGAIIQTFQHSMKQRRKIFLLLAKKRKICMLEKYSDIWSAGDTEWAYFFPFWHHQTAQK